jgi:hypothetical protein
MLELNIRPWTKAFWIGIELNQIFKGLRLTAFTDMANQLPRFEDNIAIKLSFIIKIGL